MNFLKKLFQTSQAKNQDKLNPQNRAHRIKLAPIEEVYFAILIEGSIQKFRIANLSTSGIGLLTDTSLATGKTFSGYLEIREKQIPLKIIVVYNNAQLCGAHFVECPNDFKAEILSHFKMQYMGSLMSQVNPAYLHKTEKGEIRWFVDGARNELYYLVDKDGIIDYHMSFLKHYIEGGRNLPIKTGCIDNSKGKDMKVKVIPGIIFDTPPKAEVIEQARTILKHLSHVPAEEIEELLKHIDSGLENKTAS